MKKIIALVLTLVTLFCMAVPAMAARESQQSNPDLKPIITSSTESKTHMIFGVKLGECSAAQKAQTEFSKVVRFFSTIGDVIVNVPIFFLLALGMIIGSNLG